MHEVARTDHRPQKRMIGKFSKVIGREERAMKPILLKCGLALAVTFAGFLFSQYRTKRIKPCPTSPKRHPSGNGSDVNLGRGKRASCSKDVSEENILDTEETCISKVIVKNSPINLSPRAKQSGEKDEFFSPELNLTKESNPLKKEVETPRSRVGSPTSYAASLDKDDYEQEIRKLRSMIRMLQERERSLEVQLLEYCGLREQEAAVMELQNRLKISNMEAKMFNLKVETLQSENRRLEALVADHAKVLSELEAAKSRIKFLKKKIKYEAEENREHIMNLKQRVAKLHDQECKAAANDQDTQLQLKRLKDLEIEVEQLRKSNLRLQMDNSELARRLDSTQILANSILEDSQAEAMREGGEQLRRENEGLAKEIERLQADRCSDIEELVYLRWINACLRHELRNYQPTSGKTAARDLSKSLSPTSEKKAKQLILEYANNEGGGSVSDMDSDQWSSSQASFHTDSGECDEYSYPLDNPSEAKANTTTSKSKFLSKLMKLIRGRDSRSSRATSQEKTISRESSSSSQYRLSVSTGNEIFRTDFPTPTVTSRRASFDNIPTPIMKDENRRSSDNFTPGSSKHFRLKKKNSVDLKIPHDSFSESGTEKSNLVKYAEALKDSSDTPNQKLHHRRSASYSSF
ncbi:hypothetical protein RJT34_17167 [Clitoria ternatea]|uniref:Protein CHUP1, chloroplastic n=1 Tax=Clitoria ternatea TaxID=43366 RepID=A0AAN9J8G3_CLITE